MRRQRNYEMDLCSGTMLPKILRFTLPLVLTGVLQLLYNAADVVVVGQFVGEEALAAVGSTGALINLIINVFMGLGVGASVVIARAYGAGDYKAVHQGVHTAILVAAISGVVVGIAGFFLARPLLQLMDNPDNVIDGATLYMKIYFLGMPANMLYTFGASILRAVGDTKRPLYYLSLSGLVNVGLNLFLVIVCHLGVEGVAIATVASQIVSMVLVLTCLMRSEGLIRLDPRKLRIHSRSFTDILRIGLPAGLQGSLFSISNVLIQSAVNSFGSVAMAGNAAAANLEGFIYTSMNAVYQADMTFSSANYGAKQYARVRRTLWLCLGTVTAIGLGLGMLFLLFGPTLLGIYNPNPEVIRFGMIRMSIILPTYFLCGLMDTMVGQMRGMGYSIVPMIVSLTGACLLRIVWLYTFFAADPTLNTLYISYPISWGTTFLLHFLCYLYANHKMPRTAPDPTAA